MALFDNTKKLFDNYIKEKLETKKSMKENNTISNDNKNNENNNKLMSISSNTEFTKKNSCGTNNPNAISITNINPQLENNNNNIYNARFQLLNGVLSAAQTKIMNNINYV